MQSITFENRANELVLVYTPEIYPVTEIRNKIKNDAFNLRNTFYFGVGT